MNSTQTAETNKTDVSIQAGITLLQTKEPADRGAAFSIMKKADLTGTGKWFNAVIEGYQKTTGVTLERSEKAKQRAEKVDAIKWAHNASSAEVEQQVATDAGQGSKFWAAWQLRKEGKWPEINIDKVFKPHFKDPAVDQDELAAAVQVLNTAKPNTRGEAYNAVSGVAKKVKPAVYKAAVASYEETIGALLVKSARTLEQEAVAAKVHAMSADEIKEHIGSLDAPDDVFWKAWANAKGGAWKGEIDRADFTPLFSKKGQAAGQDAGHAQDKGAAQQKNGEIEYDIPF